MCDKLQALLAKVSSHPRRRRQFSPAATAYANDAIILSRCAQMLGSVLRRLRRVNLRNQTQPHYHNNHSLRQAPASGIHLIASRPESNAFYWALSERERESIINCRGRFKSADCSGMWVN